MTHEAPDLLTVQQFADALGYSPSTVRRWVTEGKIRHLRSPGGTVRIPRTALDDILGGAA